MALRWVVVTWLLTCVGVLGCGALGFSDRVLWRVASPSGELVAVCQEVPAFDGPNYDVRLERADQPVRQLYSIGDGDGCTEVVWSPDGKTLAVLSGHVARIRLVDVEWAFKNVSVQTAAWSWRQVDLSTEHQRLEGSGLRFVGPLSVALHVCAKRTGGDTPACPEGAATRRFDIPVPVVTGHDTGPR
jgi:hypothetical protein